MANESIANGIIIIHKDFWNEPKIQRMIIDVFEEYSDTNYNILTNLDYLRKTNKTAKDLELEFKGTGRWTFDSTLENVFKYGFEEFEDYEYFKETIKNFNAKDIYPMIFEFSDNDPFVGFYIEQIMKLTVVSFPTVIPQINTTYKCIRKASLSINTDKGDGQTCFFCGQIKITS